jgi:rhomboid protease GluP
MAQEHMEMPDLAPDEKFVASEIAASHGLPQVPLRVIPVKVSSFPALTVTLLILLALVFVLEIQLSPDGSGGLSKIPLQTLVTLGGLLRKLVVERGQWWRLVTMMWLHENLTHLLSNSLVLFFAGAWFERRMGSLRLVVTLFFGGIGASLMSLLTIPDKLVAVGASGAIMALLTVVFVCSFRMEDVRRRRRVQAWTLFVLASSFVPIDLGFGKDIRVDNWSHLGGVLGGLPLGLVLSRDWPFARARIGQNRLTASTIAACLALLVSAGFAVRNQLVVSTLMPNSVAPTTVIGGLIRAGDLVARYPKDPRAHLARAAGFLIFQDKKGAEAELRTALMMMDAVRDLMPAILEPTLQGTLAEVLLLEGRADEARNLARNACASLPAKNVLRERLLSTQAC